MSSLKVGEMVPAACEAAEQCARYGDENAKDGWWFVRQWLCSWLLKKAQDDHMTPETADRWIERYRAIRGVK